MEEVVPQTRNNTVLRTCVCISWMTDVTVTNLKIWISEHLHELFSNITQEQTLKKFPSICMSICNLDEFIQHLFFDYHVTKYIWRVAHVSFNLPSVNIDHIFTDWVEGVDRKPWCKLLVGACTISCHLGQFGVVGIMIWF
jgi:hypothetical protein